MTKDPVTINQLRRNIDSSDFENVYSSLLVSDENILKDDDKIFLLKLAVIFLNYGDYSIGKLGYRIILRYSNQFKDYEPLYDVSINKGYIPVAKFIETRHLNNQIASDRFFNQLFSAYKENYRQKNIYLSAGQKQLVHFSKGNKKNHVLVAPTSYGKSEIIVSKVLEHIGSRVCVIVPSKALLAQTKKRLLENHDLAPKVKRIITHPDMFRGTETSFVAVLTQERLLRLLQKNPLFSLDLLLLDEAHNLLKSDSRATLLAQVIMILLKRNPLTLLNYFTPFISDSQNLVIPYSSYQLESRGTAEYIKIEKYFWCDIGKGGGLQLYDQFLNRSYSYGLSSPRFTNEITLVNTLKANKNIIYLNRPKHIIEVALRLSNTNSKVQSTGINEVINAISDFLHPDYNLIQCLRSGVVYHHGGMPDVIRLFVENAFSRIGDIKMIVTSSTLLEGVNIPAEKIFILCAKIGNHTFSKAEFKNLIGRVCRFSEIFNVDSGNLSMLEPEIYLVKGEYQNVKSDMEEFLKKTARVDLKLDDKVDNLLLKKGIEQMSMDDLAELKSSIEYLENIEPNTVEATDIRYVTSEIGQLCFKNNVYDFNIHESEATLLANLEAFNVNRQIDSTEGTMDAIYQLFIKDINIVDENFSRLDNIAARKFYSMVLEWRTTGSSYKQMIGKFTSYWKKLTNPIIYAGGKWGEISYDENTYKTLYIDLRTKSDAERVNIAILRIKEEQDYVDNNLIKYIEIVNELGLVEADFYERLKYGSADKSVICLLKNGFSIDLAKCVMEPAYASFVQIDLVNDEVLIDRAIVKAMEINGENQILIFEVSYHTS